LSFRPLCEHPYMEMLEAKGYVGKVEKRWMATASWQTKERTPVMGCIET
jgi:hypothetical protein